MCSLSVYHLNRTRVPTHPKSSFIRLAFLSAPPPPATPMFIELAAVTMLLPDETEEPSERSPPSTAASNLPLAAASIRFCFVGASDLCKWRERENERNGF